ncbi:hypothetical protein Hanom_Chr04g00326581 [Helianthus anomalus]
MFIQNFRRCPLPLKLMSFVINVFKSCTLCSLGQTQLDFLVKSGHPGSKLQVLSFMFVSNCRRCPLLLNLTSFVLNVSKSYTLCPLALTQSDFFIKYGHVGIFIILSFRD